MAERRPQKIESLEALQKAVPLIVKAVNDDPALGLRAAANPLLAAEELGFQIAPEIQPAIERRVRFSAEKAARLDELEAEVYKLAGERFNLDSPQQLERVLFVKLKLPRPEPQSEPPVEKPPAGKPARKRTSASAGAPLVGKPEPHRRLVTPPPDELEPLRGAHAVMEPLLAYRAIERAAARLAPRELYERIRRGEVKLPITRIQARLKRSRTPQ